MHRNITGSYRWGCTECPSVNLAVRQPGGDDSGLPPTAAKYRCNYCGATFDDPRDRSIDPEPTANS